MAMYFTSGGIYQLDALLPAKIRNNLQRDNWELFQRDMDKRLRMFGDNWKDQLEIHIKSSLSQESIDHFFPAGRKEPIWPLPIHMNLLKRIVQKISLVYKSNATRRFERKLEPETISAPDSAPVLNPIGEGAEETFENDSSFATIADGQYNSMMLLVNQLVNLCNVVLVRACADIKQKKGIRFDILTPDMFTPIQHPDDPSTLIGVIICIDLTDTGNSVVSLPTRKEVIFYIGTGDPADPPFYAETSNQSYTNRQNLVKQPYPYYRDGKPFLPIAVFRSEYPQTGQFVNRTKGEDLVDGTLTVGRLTARWIRAFEDHSGKQLVITGSGAGKAPLVFIRDSLSVLRLDQPAESSKLDQIDFTIDLKALWESILLFVESVTSTYGVNIDQFKSTPASGISLKIQNESLIEIIQSQWEIYRAGEAALADIVRAINNTQLPSGQFPPIAEDAEFRIDFGPLPFEDDPIEMIDSYFALADKGIMSYAEIHLKLNPDAGTVEEAEAQIKRNLQSNKEIRRGSGMGTGLASIPPPANQAIPTPPNPLIGAGNVAPF